MIWGKLNLGVNNKESKNMDMKTGTMLKLSYGLKHLCLRYNCDNICLRIHGYYEIKDVQMIFVLLMTFHGLMKRPQLSNIHSLTLLSGSP